MVTIDDITAGALEEQKSGVIEAVKELTSSTLDDRKKDNIDFKTRLNIKEICAHCSLEWLNEVVQSKQKFSEELLIVHLVEKMKRLRVSQDGLAREGIENMFKSEKQQDDKNMFQKMFAPKNPAV
jgi:hypothetical protein